MTIVTCYGSATPPGRKSTASIQRALEAKAARRRRWLIGAAITVGILAVLGAGILIGRFLLG